MAHIEMHVFTTCLWMGFSLWLQRTPFWEKMINEEADLTTSIYRKVAVRSPMLVMASLVGKDLWRLQLRQNWNCLEESTPSPGAFNGGNPCVDPVTKSTSPDMLKTSHSDFMCAYTDFIFFVYCGFFCPTRIFELWWHLFKHFLCILERLKISFS